VHDAGRNREDPFENSATRILVLFCAALAWLNWEREIAEGVVGWLVVMSVLQTKCKGE